MSDISYLKTSWAFDVPTHSRALLAAILCLLVTLYAPQVAARFWHSTFSQPHVVVSMLPPLLSIHLKLITVLDYSCSYTKQLAGCSAWFQFLPLIMENLHRNETIHDTEYMILADRGWGKWWLLRLATLEPLHCAPYVLLPHSPHNVVHSPSYLTLFTVICCRTQHLTLQTRVDNRHMYRELLILTLSLLPKPICKRVFRWAVIKTYLFSVAEYSMMLPWQQWSIRLQGRKLSD